jgi:hypothetical protein
LTPGAAVSTGEDRAVEGHAHEDDLEEDVWSDERAEGGDRGARVVPYDPIDLGVPES